MKKPFTTTIIITTLLIISSALTSSYASYVSAETVDNSQLIITGLVANPLNLSHAEIAAMPKSIVNAAIICVDFPGHVVAQGNWAGVKLRILLEAAKPSAEAVKIAFYADDGYSTDLPMETVMRDDIIVAYEKDGEALGALRLVVPGKWGYKWINQLTRIELVDYDFLGFWESRGYSDDADISSSELNINEPLLPSNVPLSPPLVTTPTAEPSPSPFQSYTNSPVPFQPSPTSTSRRLCVPAEAGYVIAVAIAVISLAVVLLRHKNRL
ncbi:MAG: molybdopterin-dependent oxidoreductase [Candidatus Bathyarchaeota archaeon]|nr:molybdopterin-dependent oxidoreductase [Candidatus Bathyarchaeota archaeon]